MRAPTKYDAPPDAKLAAGLEWITSRAWIDQITAEQRLILRAAFCELGAEHGQARQLPDRVIRGM